MDGFELPSALADGSNVAKDCWGFSPIIRLKPGENFHIRDPLAIANGNL